MIRIVLLLGVIGWMHVLYAYEPEVIVYENPQEVELKPALYRAETQEERITRKIEEAFPDDPLMVTIAKCESTLEPKAKNPNSSAKGVFQIMESLHGDGRDLYDEDVNIEIAKKLYDENKYGDWYASRHCWSSV